MSSGTCGRDVNEVTNISSCLKYVTGASVIYCECCLADVDDSGGRCTADCDSLLMMSVAVQTYA